MSKRPTAIELSPHAPRCPHRGTPSVSLHREAGGYCAHFDGTPYLPTHRSGGLVYAPDEESWHAVRAALLD